MLNPSQQRGPESKAEKITAAVFVLIVFGMFAASIVTDFTPVKASALFFILFWFPLLILHEGAHAITATMLGWNVGWVVIGMGNTLRTFRIGGAIVEIRTFPLEGFVSSMPRNLRLPGLKNGLIYFAGPGSELLLSLAIWLVLGTDRLFSMSDDYVTIFWQTLALEATFQAVINLIPLSVEMRGRFIANDGLGILLSFVRPAHYYAEMVNATFDENVREWKAYDPADWWKQER